MFIVGNGYLEVLNLIITGIPSIHEAGDEIITPLEF